MDGFYSKNVDDLSPSEEVVLEDILLKIEAQDLSMEATTDTQETELNEEEEDDEEDTDESDDDLY